MRNSSLSFAASLFVAFGGMVNAANAGPVVITNDHGGCISNCASVGLPDYAARMAAYKAAGQEIQIRGVCNSACTLALAAEKVCVYRSARVGFHMGYNPNTHEVAQSESDQLFRSYPAGVRAMLGGLTKGMRIFTGDQLIQAGVKPCLPSRKAQLMRAASPLQHVRH